MRFTFLAPFRTDLNFNSVSMAANPGALEPTLEHVFKWYANNSTPGISLQSHRKASRSGQLYYSGLAEDALPSTVKPVFELILSNLLTFIKDCTGLSPPDPFLYIVICEAGAEMSENQALDLCSIGNFHGLHLRGMKMFHGLFPVVMLKGGLMNQHVCLFCQLNRIRIA